MPQKWLRERGWHADHLWFHGEPTASPGIAKLAEYHVHATCLRVVYESGGDYASSAIAPHERGSSGKENAIDSGVNAPHAANIVKQVKSVGSERLAARSALLSAIFAMLAVAVPIGTFWWQNLRDVRDLALTIVPERFDSEDSGDINIQFIFDNRGTKPVLINLIGILQVIGKQVDAGACHSSVSLEFANTTVMYQSRNEKILSMQKQGIDLRTRYTYSRAREIDSPKTSYKFIYGVSLPPSAITSITGNVDIGAADFPTGEMVVFCPIIKFLTPGQPQKTAICQGWVTGKAMFTADILLSIYRLIPLNQRDNCSREYVTSTY